MSSVSAKIKKQVSVIKGALFMSAGTFVSRILGLVRDMVIGSFFSRTETDAFFVAFRMPNFFRRFLGEGSLAFSFIPIFVHCLELDTKEGSSIRAKNFMNSIYTLLLILVSLLTVLGIIFMDVLLGALFQGTPFSAVEGKMSMAITMARFLFVYLFLISVYAYFMGIANALGSFFIPAVAPAFVNLGVIIFAFLPKDLVSFPPLLLCWGVLVGGLIQTGMTVILLYRLQFLPRLRWDISSPGVKLMGRQFFLGIFGVGGFALIGLLNLYFSGWLEEGAHTYIYYGDRLLELPRSLIAVSLGTALLPSLSRLIAQGEKEKMWQVAMEHRNTLLFLILPCAIGFYFLSAPIVEVLFQRGRFDSFTAQQTAIVLQIYSVLLVSSSFARVLASCFYAVKNMWFPAISSFLYVGFHFLITPYMIKAFALEGLIWATVFSNIFFMSILCIAYPFFVGRFYLLKTFQFLLLCLPALAVFSVYIAFLFPYLNETLDQLVSAKLSAFLSVFFVIISSIPIYLLAGRLFKIPQAGYFSKSIVKKITKLSASKQ